jgi:hypothetical protein
MAFCIILFSPAPAGEQISFVILSFVSQSDVKSTEPMKVTYLELKCYKEKAK